jgi:TM2 domain-containing membrane protein YozV
MNYYIAAGSVQQGPFAVEQLRGMGLHADTLVWAEGMAQWQPAGQVAELQPLFTAAMPPAVASLNPAGQAIADAGSKKVLAGIFGIVLGGLGIHKFILGYTGPGLVLLLITLLTCGAAAPITHIIGLIEGIIYLTKSDEEFYRTYVVGRKAWF